MRRELKYKIFNLSRICSKRVPLRILKFKRTKWKNLQKALKPRSRFKKKFLVNNFAIKHSYKSWSFLKKFYGRNILLRNHMYQIYENSINYSNNLKYCNKIKSSKLSILAFIMKPFFRVDIFLSKLGFFSSSFAARENLNCKRITVNNRYVQGNKFLKKGDIISIKSFIFLKQNIDKYTVNEKFFSFLELDFYAGTVVLLKNFSELTAEEVSLCLNENLDLKALFK